MKREKQEKLIQEATDKANAAFDAIEAEKQAAAWAFFRRQRPLRMKLYRRQLKSAQEGVGSKLPETPLCGKPSVREERRLEDEYSALLERNVRFEAKLSAIHRYRDDQSSVSSGSMTDEV